MSKPEVFTVAELIEALAGQSAGATVAVSVLDKEDQRSPIVTHLRIERTALAGQWVICLAGYEETV